MKVVVVIQARMGSSRLPGKVAMDLNGAPVLAHVIARAAAVPGVDRVCCAIPDRAQDDPLAELAAGLGAAVSRGSESDVLDRYLVAARRMGADTVMRVTSDCPVLDPQVSGRVLAEFVAQGADYASNVDPRSWPKGLDTEVFSRAALERAAAETSDPYDREHVTPYMRRASGMRRINVANPGGDLSAWRWTLDYEQDLTFLRRLLSEAPALPRLASFEDLRGAYEADPTLAEINAGLV